MKTSEEYFKEIGWTDQSERDFFYVVNPKVARNMFAAAAIFANVMAEEFEGVSIKPRGTSGVLRLRTSVLSNMDFLDGGDVDELKKILSETTSTSFTPAGKDMIIEIMFPNLYDKIPCEE